MPGTVLSALKNVNSFNIKTLTTRKAQILRFLDKEENSFLTRVIQIRNRILSSFMTSTHVLTVSERNHLLHFHIKVLEYPNLNHSNLTLGISIENSPS